MLAIICVSLLAAVVNCYPVLFCGRSFVSPACVPALVYDWWPPLPGMEPATTYAWQHGSDAGAMMWWDVPLGFYESRCLLEQGELPLWNRYSHAGDPLVGQAVSMLGDPLQMIVILGHGSALAWDVKFLVAKFVFCVGFGWLVLRLSGNRPLSLFYAALAAYCGAWFFIGNHPVFFVFAYAPWILLSAFEFLDWKSERHLRWGLVWLLANFSSFNAGHVEVAVVLIGGLNLATFTHALVGNWNWAGVIKVFGRMAVATLLFMGLTAPVWVPFLVALDGAFTVHQEIKVIQLPLKSLPGAFDDIFYRLLMPGFSRAHAPGTSLLVMAGCILSALKWRQLSREKFFWVNTGAIALWGGCVFGWMPASILAAIPLLNRVGHGFTDFSYLLVIHLTIQSAYGFGCLTRADFKILNRRQTSARWFGWTIIIILVAASQYRFGLYNFGNEDLMMLPGPRTVLDATSPAIEKIKSDSSDPFRVVPLQRSFNGDYAMVYGLEDIRSCDPVSNGEYMQLIRNFPGMELSGDWVIKVLDPVQAQPLLNLLNVKYVLASPTNRAPVAAGFRVSDRSDFLVLENLQAWPRAFFVNQIKAVASSEEFAKQLLANAETPFVAVDSSTLESQPGLKRLEEVAAARPVPARHFNLRPNSTAFDIHAASAGIVCLMEGQAKDFTATANGVFKEVITVNRAFKGVYLDQPGDYHLEFTYRPRYWRLACLLCATSISIALMLAIVEINRMRDRQKRVALN